MSVPKIYEKDNQRVVVHNTFIYSSEIYMLWKGGASLIETKYFQSKDPIKISKNKLKVKKKKYTLFRFLELKFAPEEYCRNNGYKLSK